MQTVHALLSQLVNCVRILKSIGGAQQGLALDEVVRNFGLAAGQERQHLHTFNLAHVKALIDFLEAHILSNLVE